jgi:hypothetical protein
MNELTTIKNYPTTINNIHESCFRSYHILRYVLGVIDSKSLAAQTDLLFQIIEHLREGEKEIVL